MAKKGRTIKVGTRWERGLPLLKTGYGVRVSKFKGPTIYTLQRRKAYLEPIMASIKKQRAEITKQEKATMNIPTALKFSRRELRSARGLEGRRQRQLQALSYRRQAESIKNRALSELSQARQALKAQERKAQAIAKTIR